MTFDVTTSLCIHCAPLPGTPSPLPGHQKFLLVPQEPTHKRPRSSSTFPRHSKQLKGSQRHSFVHAFIDDSAVLVTVTDGLHVDKSGGPLAAPSCWSALWPLLVDPQVFWRHILLLPSVTSSGPPAWRPRGLFSTYTQPLGALCQHLCFKYLFYCEDLQPSISSLLPGLQTWISNFLLGT